MRVGIDASILAAPTLHSGIGRYVSLLVEHLPPAAPDDEFLLYAPRNVEPAAALAANARWVPIPLLRIGKLSMLYAYQRSLPQLARRDRLDVFHAPTVHPRPTWPSVARRLPCPLVLTIHDLIPLTFYASGHDRLPARQRLFYRWNLSAALQASRLITVSHVAAADVQRHLRVEPARLDVVPNAVQLSAPQPAPRPERPYVLYAGSFEARKNAVTAVRAFAEVAQALPEHELVVLAAGGSGDASFVRGEIATRGLGDRVRFVSAVTDGELAELYARADVFVFPSRAEGFGLPPLEAMACGTPVVASALPALRETLGDAALYAGPKDAHGFAQAIIRICGDAMLRSELTARGRERAGRFTVDAFVRGTLDVYRAAIDEAVPVPRGRSERVPERGRSSMEVER